MVQDALAARAMHLAQEGRNRLSTMTGLLPESAQQIRKTYLGWYDEVERLLGEVAGLPEGNTRALQSVRHRALVEDQVPADEMFREVAGQRDSLLSALDDVADQSLGESLTNEST